MDKPNMPLLGDKFPKLKVNTTHGKMKLPGDYKGSWFVLFSHPADFTPVCTTEFFAFQGRVKDFEALNCKLIGLSIDQIFSHIKWVEWIEDNLGTEITFPIIADDQGRIGLELGMLHPGKGSSTVRAVFIVDPEGVLRLSIYYPQEIGRNMDELLRSLRALQVSDRNGVAVPANWPNNELIGDSVIVPPAQDVKTAKERPDLFQCYDWWFCHKKLEE